MKTKAPDAPYPTEFPPSAGPQPPPVDDQGFSNFVGNTQFLRHISDPNLPAKGTGAFVPIWVAPKLANDILMQHSESGMAVPHPSIDLQDLSK